MKRLLALAVVLAACDPPSPKLRVAFDSSEVGLCPSSNCMEVPMTCKTFVSIRFLDPADPTAPYLSQCSEIPERMDDPNVCTLASVDLLSERLPLRTLEVQVALFPATAITTDPMTGEPVCPTDVKYDSSSGFPIASDVTPAIGGRAYYHAGDDQIRVNLACTDLHAINAMSCGGGMTTVPVVAKVVDFNLPVLQHTSDIEVKVGEPVSNDPFWLLAGSLLETLAPRVGPSGPEFTGDVAKPFITYTCVQVLDEAPQSTATITCRRTPGHETTYSWPSPATVGMPDDETHVGTAVWLSKASLDEMLTALGQTTFPTHGLTLGLVLDSTGTPLSNQTIVASGGTIQYFNANRDGVSGTKTSASGAFASLDAQFGTIFSVTTGMPVRTISRIGGRVDGKVTIVVLQATSGGI